MRAALGAAWLHSLLIARASHSLLVPCARSITSGARTTPVQLSAVQDLITPIGPFCPFRSQACRIDGAVDAGMGSLTTKSASFMADMARLQLESQMGNEPDPAKVTGVADELAAALEEWEVLMQRLRLSTDFQSREYFKMTEAHLRTQGQSLEAIRLAMRWQVDCMRAFAGGGGGGGMAAALGGPPAIDTTPFDGTEAAFESPLVRDEYEALCRDHAGLIDLGASYGGMDPLGKLAYLDALEAVEQRWDVFFARFSLVGALNADFKRQSSAFLSSMSLTPASFRELLARAHELMRADAEAERQ